MSTSGHLQNCVCKSVYIIYIIEGGGGIGEREREGEGRERQRNRERDRQREREIITMHTIALKKPPSISTAW